MFNLSATDLRRRILGCGDGPASFNAELTSLGGDVVSIDPLYAISGKRIERRVEEVYEVVMAQVRRNMDDFVWTHVPSIEELGRRRLWAMRRFLSDYPVGMDEGRYLDASLPVLPFADSVFDLALSSHFLFLYTAEFDLDFHLNALREMLRTADEIRVFPLLQVGGAPSPYVTPAIDAMELEGVQATVETVPYEFQRGGDRMLRLRR